MRTTSKTSIGVRVPRGSLVMVVLFPGLSSYHLTGAKQRARCLAVSRTSVFAEAAVPRVREARAGVRRELPPELAARASGQVGRRFSAQSTIPGASGLREPR